MLTSALNFLTDKRKRLARSDTLPVFDTGVTSAVISSKTESGGVELNAPKSEEIQVRQNTTQENESYSPMERYMMNSNADQLDLHSDSPTKHMMKRSFNDNKKSVIHVDHDSAIHTTDHTDGSASSLPKTTCSSADSVQFEHSDKLAEGKVDFTSEGASGVMLKRSKSSAQFSRNKLHGDKQQITKRANRSRSRQRSPSAERVPLSYTDHTSRRKSRKRVKQWMDRGRRSRSVNAIQNSFAIPEPEETELEAKLSKLISAGTKDKFHRIKSTSQKAFQSTPLDITKVYEQIFQNELGEGADNLRRTHKHIEFSVDSTNTDEPKVSIPNDKRRLRRNTSTMNWSMEKAHLLSTPALTDSISQTAGDLFLSARTIETATASKSATVGEYRDDTIIRVLKHVERDEFTRLLDEFDSLRSLVERNRCRKASISDSDGLSILDVALLSASPKVIIYLMALGFQPGSVLQTLMTLNPTDSNICDPMRLFLLRRMGDLELKLIEYREELKSLINRANKITHNESLSDSPSVSMSQASMFSQVTHVEGQLFAYAERRERLVRLYHGLDRYPSKPEAPKKVTLMVSGPTSLLVRISPHPNVKSSKMTPSRSEDVHSSDSSSDDSTYLESGRRFTETDDLDHKNLILRYRIEWSVSKYFPCEETYSCIVEPTVNTSLISKPGPHVCSLFRTGFYEIADLKESQNYFVRVYTMSLRGWSDPCPAQPVCMRLSSWYTSSLKVTSENLKNPPIRYVGEGLLDEFRTIRQTLDQQLLAWVHNMSKTGTDASLAKIMTLEDSTRKPLSPMLQRKRSFRFPFVSKGLKFVKQAKSGIYLAIAIHSNRINTDEQGNMIQEKQLVSFEDNIPMVCVSNEDIRSINSFQSDFNWFARLISDPTIGPDLQVINDNLLRIHPPGNMQFRFRLIEAFTRLQSATGISYLGDLYPEIIHCTPAPKESGQQGTATSDHSENSSFADEFSSGHLSTTSVTTTKFANEDSAIIMVLSRYVPSNQKIPLISGLKWSSVSKILRLNKLNLDALVQTNTDEESTRNVSLGDKEQTQSNDVVQETCLLTKLETILSKSESRTRALPPGLYVAFIQMQANIDQNATVLISNLNENSFLFPLQRVRRRHHVTCTEWQTLYRIVLMDRASFNVSKDIKFCQRVYQAAVTLANKLGFESTYVDQLRIFLSEVIRISPEHSLILLCPPIDEVCLPPGFKNQQPPNCSWCSMHYVERNIGMTYDPHFYTECSSLTALLELLLALATFIQRQSLTDEEWTNSSERTSALQSIQQQLEQLYSGKRWLGDVLASARDRKRDSLATVNMAQIKEYLSKYNFATFLDKEIVSRSHSSRWMSLEKTSDSDRAGQSENEKEGSTERQTCVLLVHVDYKSGLPPRSGVKVLVRTHTTAEEIVRLTVTKVTETLNTKYPSGLVTSMHLPSDYCLTVSIGTKSHQLKNSTRPLLLKPPWRFGRYGVRSLLDDDKSNTPSDSPVRIYLTKVQNDAGNESQQAEQWYRSTRSEKAQYGEMPRFYARPKVTPPPVVYLNGVPIQI